MIYAQRLSPLMGDLVADPRMERLASLLGQPAPLPMDKAMVVALDIGHGPTATLRFIVDPRTLRVVNDARDAREP